MNEHFVQALTARAVRKAAFVITPSYEIANRLAEWGGRVEMAIPLLKIAGVIGEPRASCRMLDGQLRILYVGELRGPKGVDVLLDAFTELTGSLGEVGKGAHLTLVGDGEMKLRVSEIVRERGLEASVAIRGHIADAQRLAEEYLAADIFVLPSRSEGFPRVLYEAMAAGLPVVATRVGGIPTLLRDGVDALLVAVGEPGAIAEAVYRLATDQELYSRISLNGLAVFRQRVVERSAMGRSLANQVAELFDLADGCGLSPDSV